MRRLLVTLGAALGLMVLVVAAYVVVDRVRGDAREPTTAGGLAYGVMTHLGSREVTSVSGDLTGDHAMVSIETTDPTATSVLVTVGPRNGSGPGVCGTDDDYTEVSCTNGPLREVGRRRGSDDRHAIYSGTFEDDERGVVTVQVYGTDGGERAVALVEELLDDPLVGRTTSPERNERGGEIDDLAPLVLRLEAVEVAD